MILAFHFAITDLLLEQAEVLLIFIIIVVIIGSVSYIRRLKAELRRQQSQAEDQAKFNAKLNATVDRILEIEKEGSIDSNRRNKKK